jgi:hypothetical protein
MEHTACLIVYASSVSDCCKNIGIYSGHIYSPAQLPFSPACFVCAWYKLSSFIEVDLGE